MLKKINLVGWILTLVGASVYVATFSYIILISGQIRLLGPMELEPMELDTVGAWVYWSLATLTLGLVMSFVSWVTNWGITNLTRKN